MIILEQFTFWMANSILPEKETGHPIWTASHRARRKAAYKARAARTAQHHDQGGTHIMSSSIAAGFFLSLLWHPKA